MDNFTLINHDVYTDQTEDMASIPSAAFQASYVTQQMRKKYAREHGLVPINESDKSGLKIEAPAPRLPIEDDSQRLAIDQSSGLPTSENEAIAGTRHRHKSSDGVFLGSQSGLVSGRNRHRSGDSVNDSDAYNSDACSSDVEGDTVFGKSLFRHHSSDTLNEPTRDRAWSLGKNWTPHYSQYWPFKWPQNLQRQSSLAEDNKNQLGSNSLATGASISMQTSHLVPGFDPRAPPDDCLDMFPPDN